MIDQKDAKITKKKQTAKKPTHVKKKVVGKKPPAVSSPRNLPAVSSPKAPPVAKRTVKKTPRRKSEKVWSYMFISSAVDPLEAEWAFADRWFASKKEAINAAQQDEHADMVKVFKTFGDYQRQKFNPLQIVKKAKGKK